MRARLAGDADTVLGGSLNLRFAGLQSTIIGKKAPEAEGYLRNTKKTGALHLRCLTPTEQAPTVNVIDEPSIEPLTPGKFLVLIRKPSLLYHPSPARH